MKTNKMKKQSRKNKKQANQNQLRAAPCGAPISEAIKQLTDGSNILTPRVQLATLQTVAASPQPMAYKMRVECYDDGALLFEMFTPYLEYWEEKRETIEAKGKQFDGPAFEVRFGITPGTLTLQHLQSLIHCVPDCHVAEETVAPEFRYTGERKTVAESSLQAPEAALIRPMVQRAEHAHNYVRVLLRRAESLCRMLNGVAASGELPQMPREGSIVLLEHKPSGLSSIRRVAAASGTLDPVKDRLLLLQQ